jgi:tRNA(fMet)-specific endonuclease VapC
MVLRYLLDTNICIYIAKKKPVNVLNKFERLKVGSVGMSMITYGELIYRAKKSHHPKKTMTLLEELVSLIPALPLPVGTAKWYGEIRHHLEKQGKPIGNNDLWIASHALAMKLVLVTNNEREFLRISKLKIENWTK